MIRGWFRRRPAPAVHRSVDEAVFFGAQLDVRDAQIEGLRDALAEANARADAAERRSAVLEGRLARHEAAELMRRGLMEHMRRPAREREHSSVLEPTVVINGDAFQATRPAGPAPATEQWPR